MSGRLALVAGGVLAGLALVEGAVRLVHHGAPPSTQFATASASQHSRWIAHPFLPFAGRPSGRFEMYNGPERTPEIIVTNSYGFRAHEFPAEKKPNDYFILAFGGSTTYGYKTESNAVTWPEMLERTLAERYPEKNVVAFNLGVDMATSAVSVVNLALVGVHLEPDLVIAYHGYNDLASLGYANHRSDGFHFYKDIDPDALFRGFQRNTPRALLSSYAIFYATGALDHAFGMNDLTQTARREKVADPDRFKGLESTLENLKTIHALATDYGADALFSTFQFTTESSQPEYQRMNEELRRWFRANRWHWVDQAALIPDDDPTVNVDDCHFTHKGNEMLTDNFYRYIVEHGLVK
jgi:lysophospholipase L1-like esterase